MKIKDFALLIALSPLLLLLKLLRPLVVVRFGYINSSHLGFSINEPIVYLLEKREFQFRRSLDLFGLDGKNANDQVVKMLKRELFASILITSIYKSICKLSLLKKYLVPFREEQYFDIHGLVGGNPPALKFTKAEIEMGRESLRNMGLAEESKFVCFCIRDSAYDHKVGGQIQSNINTYRNTLIEDYEAAIHYLLERKIYVLRMGASIADDFKIDSPYYIDYAQNYRTEFLDIFLCANCHFYFGDSAGLVNVARIFKRPIALCNWIPMGLVSTHDKNTLIIHKRLLGKSGKDMPLSEQLSSDCVVFERTADYLSRGLGVIDNSEEENLELVKEMYEKLEGCWNRPEDYDVLQNKYWSSFKPNILREPLCSKIGYEFLRRYMV